MYSQRVFTKCGRHPILFQERFIVKRLLVYLKGYGRECILAPSFKMLEALMDLFVPLVVAGIIDRGIAQGDKGYIIHQFILLLLLAAAGLLASFTAQFFAARASVGFAARVRQALFDHVESLSYSNLDTVGTDTLINRMTSDVQQMQNGLNIALRLLLRSPFIVFGSMIMAFRIDVKAALVFAVAIPVLGMVVYGIMIASIPLFSRVQKGLDAVLEQTRENLTGVRVIRAFGREPDEVRTFDEKNDRFTRLNEKVGRLSAAMNPATYALINIATVVLIYVGALRVNSGSLTQGEVVALYNYMAQMIVELIKMASVIITLNKSIACAGRVADVLKLKPGMEFPGGESVRNNRCQVPSESIVCIEKDREEDTSDKSLTPAAPAVKFDHVSFGYSGSGEAAITDVSFSARKGQTIGIIGGTGSGKSSVVNLIPRFYDAAGGKIEIDGKDIRSYTKQEIIGKVGVVPQKAVLFQGTIRSNLMWGDENASDDNLWEALTTAQCRDVVEHKDGQLDAEVEQGGRNFSGGQRQRLTIARALVKNPEILILDDSASALDFATDARLRKAIHQMEGERTVFIVSQRCSSVMQADRILVMDDGILAGSGTHEELLKSNAVYQEIFYSQFPEQKQKPTEHKQKPMGQKPGSVEQKPQKDEHHPAGPSAAAGEDAVGTSAGEEVHA